MPEMTNRVELSFSERFAFAGDYEFDAAGAYERLMGGHTLRSPPTGRTAP